MAIMKNPAEHILGAFGYRLVREPKSERLQLLVRKTTKDGLKLEAKANGQSLNDLANDIFEDYLERQSR